MKRILFIATIYFLTSHLCCAQSYFKPKVGGLENVNDGNNYFRIEIKEKDSLQIYNALLSMVKEKFNGDEDEILEKEKGSYIKARGIIKKYVCDRDYDVKFDVEFKIKNGRYIFLFSKFNIEKYDGSNKIVFQKGGNVFDSGGRTFMFNKKGKINIQKLCYKSIVRSLDLLGNMFDISDEFEKYLTKKNKRRQRLVINNYPQ